MRQSQREAEALTPSKAAEFLLDECRMVLPGIQALLGFQLISVFSQGFGASLSGFEQRLHLLAILLVVVAIAIIMTPAALHRANPREVGADFILLTTRLLPASMFLLALSISIDFYLVGRVILGGIIAVPAAALFMLFVTLWFVLPRSQALQGMMVRGLDASRDR